ncbi:glycosyltransferase [Ammoniphilus sp. CFH 90114]|uniref:MGDG synthase family glycosyltransferase n=1 Tax=Ammoniphilus sp. CFH 90114 TaxID=2493665 RepID=UPI0013E97B47|nr:glycosyltransferase [Ammoniphilus sp. CFH 90114]
MYRTALILSEPYGGGHTKAAKAVSKLLKDWNYPILELGNYLHPRLSSHLTRGYLKTVQKAPWIWGKLYSSPITESQLIPYMYRKIYTTKLAALLLQTKPDVIIATHPLPAIAISSLRKYKIDLPLVGVVTDFHIHPSRSLADWNVLCIPSQVVPSWLDNTTGIVPTGIPVQPSFHTTLSKPLAKKNLNLDLSKPVVLWMGGSDGFLQDLEWVSMCSKDPSTQWLFVTGRNRKLFNTLQDNYRKYPHLQIYGYVDDISTLMDASDLLVTKPGGVTCSEAIHKGLPLLLTNGVTGQEEENRSFLLQQGLADYCASHEIKEKSQAMISNFDNLERIKWNMLRYKHSIQPNRIASTVEMFLGQNCIGHSPYH